MPIYGTPIAGAGSVSCLTQTTSTPEITIVSGSPSLARRRAIEVVQGQANNINFTIHNLKGDPIDLSLCDDIHVELRIREVLSMNSTSNPGVTIAGNILDATTGLVEAQLTDEVVAMPGISLAEFGVLNEDDQLLFSNQFYLVVNRGQFASEVVNQGPPSVAEIRLHLRDSDPADNLWLGLTEFDLAEIAACIERPILYWNEAPPPIRRRYNTSNFPFRYHWLEGIVACLYQLAAAHYRRVHLPHSSAGLSIDDKNKSQEYEEIGRRRWDEYKSWVQWKKVQFNAVAAMQITGSPYNAGYGWTR